MKITKTAPQNKDFFNEHGSSLASYGLIGFIGQILSGISLAYAVYALILAQVLQQGMPIGATILGLVALVVALFIELANRILARRAIKPFVVKGLFNEDPEAAGRHKILNNSYLVGLLAIAALSYFLSAVGSSYYAEDSSRGPALISTDSLKEVYAAQLADLDRAFSRDSSTLSGPYDQRLQAIHDRYQADSLALRKERERYRVCADQGKAYCKSKLNDYLARIDRSKAAMSDSIALVSSLKGNALQTALADRNAKAQNIDEERSATLFLAEQKNSELLKEAANDSSFKGLVFIILTIAGQTVFYLMVYLSLQVEAGSDIQYEVEPNEFWNLPSVIEEWKVMIAWRSERGLRRLLRWVFGEPGEHETAIPYRGLFENVNQDNMTQSLPLSSPQSSVTFIAQNFREKKHKTPRNTKLKKTQNPAPGKTQNSVQQQTQNLTQLKQRLKMYKKRVGSVKQRAIKFEKAGKTVPKNTLNAIANNQKWVDELTRQIQELEAVIAPQKSK